MQSTSTHKINIAGLTLNVCIDDSFKNIREFIGRFKDRNIKSRDASLLVYISKSYERKVKLSNQWNILYITGYKIDDLSNPFNLIGLVQALFRFTAIHLAKKGVFLLHGSAAVLDNRIVCFGEDNKASTAKTLSSIETALQSNLYIADEFCFFDVKNNRIFGYQFIPIHIRSIVEEYFKFQYDFVLPKSNYKETEAGKFIKPDKLFQLTSGKLDALSYVRFSSGGTNIEKLSQKEACKSFKFCITSHIAKLLYPELDRMKFTSMTDATDKKDIDEKIIDEILLKTTKGFFDSRVCQEFANYKLVISQPHQIIPFLRRA